MKDEQENIFDIINVLGSMHKYVFWKDTNSSFVGCNDKFKNLIGFRRKSDTILGKTDFDIVPTDLANKFISLDKKIMETKQPVINMIEKYNNEVLKINKYPIINSYGVVIGIVCTMDELLDEEEKITEEIKTQDIKYKLLIENLSEGIIVADKKMNIAFANKAISNMLGYELIEIIGKPILDLVSEDKSEKIKEKLKSMESPNKQRYETEFIKSNGSKIAVLVQCSSFFDKDNNFKGIVASVLDMTETAIAKEELKKKEEMYRGLIEFTNAAYFILDEKLTIIKTNQSFSEAIGIEMENLIGCHPRRWVVAKDVPLFDKSFEGVINGNPIKEIELGFIRPDKKTVHFSVNANIIRNGTDKVLCLLRDISHKKEIELRNFIQEQKKKDRIKQKISEIRDQLKSDSQL